MEGELIQLNGGGVTWERMKGESGKAYEAFKIYRDMGPTRSYIKVSQKLQKSFTLMGRWGGRWNWQDRVHAYELYQDRVYLSSMADHKRDLSERGTQFVGHGMNIAAKWFNKQSQSEEAANWSMREITWFLSILNDMYRTFLGAAPQHFVVSEEMETNVRKSIGMDDELLRDPEMVRLLSQATAHYSHLQSGIRQIHPSGAGDVSQSGVMGTEQTPHNS